MRRGGVIVGVVAGLLLHGCAHQLSPAARRGEQPPAGRPFWEENGCSAHSQPQWHPAEKMEGSQLSGWVTWTPSDGEVRGVPDAVAYVRRWPRGETVRVAADANGEFLVPNIADGLFEVAVCADGWNPWWGTVRVRHRAKLKGPVFGLVRWR